MIPLTVRRPPRTARLAEAANLQVIGGNPLTAEEIAVSRFAIRRGPNKMSLI